MNTTRGEHENIPYEDNSDDEENDAKRIGCWQKAAPRIRKLLGFKDKDEEIPEDDQRNPIYFPNAILPVQYYLRGAMWSHWLVNEEAFSYVMILVIIVAGVLVGAETYPSINDSPVTIVFDAVVVYIFGLEIILKLLSEGLAPWRYFVGAEWGWNCFDFAVVFLSLSSSFNLLKGGNSFALLRLVRLARLGKLIRRIPALQMIVAGLAGGMSSISYIMLLLILVFYLYGVMGFYLYSVNDPYHFGTLPLSMLTLFRITLFDNWGDLIFQNIFGCVYYPDMYVDEKHRTPANRKLWCRNPEARPPVYLTGLFFVSFIVIAAFVMLSLFIGSVTLSMNESMTDLKNLAEEKRRQAAYEANKKKMEQMESFRRRIAGQSSKDDEEARNGDTSDKDMEGNSFMNRLEGWAICKPFLILYNYIAMTLEELEFDDHRERDASIAESLSAAMGWKEELAFEKSDSNGISVSNFREIIKRKCGQGMAASKIQSESKTNIPEVLPSTWAILKFFHDQLSLFCKWLVYHDYSVNFTTVVIILASVNVGLQSEISIVSNPQNARLLDLCDSVIVAIFTVECGLKLLAEGRKPWKYFYSRWNCFDALIVIACYIPGSGGTFTILRLLRLLRVLRLVKRLPQLAIIVDALINAMGSIGYIGLILFLFLYVFAILGMIMFQTTDPWHYGTLHASLITLFRVATLDNWAHVMYITMYGCEIGGYGDVYASYPEQCTDTSTIGAGAVAALYYVIFTVIGAQVLLSLFIGVISTSMEESRQQKKDQMAIESDLRKKAIKLGLTPDRVEAFQAVFSILDLDDGGTISEDELVIGLSAIKLVVSPEQMYAMLEKVDPERNGINICGFIDFMAMMPDYKKGAAHFTSMFKKSGQQEKVKVPFYTPIIKFFFGKSREEEEEEEMEAAMIIQEAWVSYRQKQIAKDAAAAAVAASRFDEEQWEKEREEEREAVSPPSKRAGAQMAEA